MIFQFTYFLLLLLFFLLITHVHIYTEFLCFFALLCMIEVVFPLNPFQSSPSSFCIFSTPSKTTLPSRRYGSLPPSWCLPNRCTSIWVLRLIPPERSNYVEFHWKKIAISFSDFSREKFQMRRDSNRGPFGWLVLSNPSLAAALTTRPRRSISLKLAGNYLFCF